jgi:hypothetical protein
MLEFKLFTARFGLNQARNGSSNEPWRRLCSQEVVRDGPVPVSAKEQLDSSRVTVSTVMSSSRPGRGDRDGASDAQGQRGREHECDSFEHQAIRWEHAFIESAPA